MAGRQATTATTQQTLRQRGVEATRALREALSLPADVNDTAILGTALAAAAAREIGQNAHFAREVRREYDELTHLRGQTRGRTSCAKPNVPPLVPKRYAPGDVDPYAPPDPKTLAYVYGSDKLGQALDYYSLDKLKQTAAKLEAAHPGTKPASRAKKQAVIEYILNYWQA